MAWIVELSATATRQVENLDVQHAKRILKFVYERLVKLDSPRDIGKALHGSNLGEFWKYRVGDFRLICRIEDERLVVLVLQVGHRKDIYR
jgi:mRNA interferase RelE/StbE